MAFSWLLLVSGDHRDSRTEIPCVSSSLYATRLAGLRWRGDLGPRRGAKGVAELSPRLACVRVCLLTSCFSLVRLSPQQLYSTSAMVRIISILVAAFALVARALGDGPGVEQALAESPFFAHSKAELSYAKRDDDEDDDAENPVSLS